VRVYFYILDRSKIVARLCELSLGDMEEFSDIPDPRGVPQPNLPKNETTDIPIFNVPEIIPQKIIPLQPEKSTPSPNTSKDKKADKQGGGIQDLFDYVAEDTRAPVASTSGTSETSKPFESVIGEPETIELPESIKPISKNMNTPPKETPTDSPKPINQVSSDILLARAQREERLRKKAVELGENPDAFVIITEKDRLDSKAFRDRMEMDSRMCGWAEEMEEDPKEHMDMTTWERLIGEEIIRRSLEKDGVTSSWLDTDKKWKKTVSILQENGMLW
jgi:hypothetical protein